MGENCIRDVCDNFTEYLNINGSCKVCDNFKHANPELNEGVPFTSCVADPCNDGTDYLEQWGIKATCQAYTRPDKELCLEARSCIRDDCNWNTDILSVNGKCQSCGVYTRPNGTDEFNRDCISDICEEGEILLEDGTCKPCDAYSHPDTETKNCITDSCDFTVQKLLVTGMCETCPDYTRPVAPDAETGWSKDCMEDVCDLER